MGYDPSSVSELRDLVEVLRSQVEMLRAELHEAHAANRETRRIIAALTERIPELPPPSSEEPRESRETATAGPVEPTPQSR